MINFLLKILKGRRTLPWAILDGLILMTTPFRISGNRVLILRLNAIGDFVLWLDAARTIVEHYRAQGRTVVIIGDISWADWAKELNLADEVWSIDTKRFVRNLPYRLKWLRRVRKEGFEIVIQPTISRMFLSDDSLVRACGSPVRIGSVGETSNIHPWFRNWSNHWYTHLIPISLQSLMELKRNAEFMNGIGFTDFQARLPVIPRLPTKKPDNLPLRPYVVLFLGASWAGRIWPVENFAEIAQKLLDLQFQIVVAGGLADSSLAFYMANRFPGQIVDLVNKTSLSTLAEVLRAAELVITNETSAVHIGTAVGVQVVCIVGGGHFGRFVPYEIDVPSDSNQQLLVTQHMSCFGCNWDCIYPHSMCEPVKCIRDISVQAVWNAVEVALAGCKSFQRN